MTVLVETRHPGEFILSEANGQRSRETITIASGAGIIAAGTVLGKVTASGRYVASAVGASDGSEVPAAINIYGADASSADATVSAKVGGVNVEVSDAGVAITGGKVTHDGKNIGSTHIHGGVEPGGGLTDVPAN